MYPILFQWGPLTIHTYGVLLVVAWWVAVTLAQHRADGPMGRYLALASSQLVEWGVVAMLSGLVGARAWYVLQHWAEIASSPLEILAIWHGGLVWYGGFIGGVIGTWGFAARARVSFLSVLDQIIPVAALGHGIGRVGCFLNGCCYGKPTTAWYGVVFPEDPTTPRIPIQLIEAGALGCLAFLLWRVQRPTVLARRGRLFGLYLLSYALLRFVLEWFRGDQLPLWFDLTLPQLVSLVMGVVGVGLLTRKR